MKIVTAAQEAHYARQIADVQRSVQRLAARRDQLYERATAAERECDQLRTLLRAIRRLSEPQPNDSMNAHFSPVAKMIDASGLLDDEGQQR